MNILHITNNYPTTKNPIFGIFVKEQIDSLNSLDCNNDIFFINGRENGKLEYIKSIIRLRRFLKNRHFDVIHCHHALSAMCFILSGRSRSFKSVVSYQNDPSKELGLMIFKLIHRGIDAIVLKNESPLVNNISIFHQPNGVDTRFFYKQERDACISYLNLEEQKKYILFISSNYVRKQKRYDKFAKILDILKNKYGMTNIEELKMINVKRELVPLYFGASSLHLLTSDFEGSPNSVKEAMACDIPIVSTNVGNVKNLLSGVTGSYVSLSNTAEELADLSFKALNYEGKYSSRRLLSEKKLDIESVANNIILIYKKITNE